MTDNFNIPSFCCIFETHITSIETRNVRFFRFVFSVKGLISVIMILVVAVYQQILSNTEQGFIGFLRGNQTSTYQQGGGSWNFQRCFRGGSVIFVPKGGGGPYVFCQPHFQMLRPTPPPPPPQYFFTSVKHTLVRKRHQGSTGQTESVNHRVAGCRQLNKQDFCVRKRKELFSRTQNIVKLNITAPKEKC